MRTETYNKICLNCINFIKADENNMICDFEYWPETVFHIAILNVPEMFDCINFEYSIDIKEKLEKKRRK